MEISTVTVLVTSQGEEVRSEMTNEEAADTILKHRQQVGSFALDLAKSQKNGGVTKRQRPYLHKEAMQIRGTWHENGEEAPGGFDSIVEYLETGYQNGLRYPSMCFPSRHEEKGGLELSRASARSSRPGSVHVTPVRGDAYFGRIRTDGTFHSRKAAPKGLIQTLREIAEDPGKAARREGMETGACSFCNSELTESGSVEVGYGPVCASNFGLPHPQHG